MLFILAAPGKKEDDCLFNVLKHIWDGAKCTLMESINLFNQSN